ncbi:hypothetical protein VB773_17520 [Haloarculaceae archaeon H-GB2-1]|nr:hypothetical protein [Haloarculaceae archaeon H-GB1-1]MEA5387701.1 hypothetical protein [Haloarculaceae archaeon H-GB11]MEA5409191.1 hypothetical protein [Haloarculaceae archaeon H-GB2-1]
MDVTADELAGIVDLFDALTREELAQALSELAFKRREDVAAEAFDDDVEAALSSYHLVAVPAAEEDFLVTGPSAFPSLPADAEDLPHILDVPERRVDHDRLARVVSERFEADVSSALAEDDTDRIKTLLEVSYDLPVWADVDVEASRARLDDALA